MRRVGQLITPTRDRRGSLRNGDVIGRHDSFKAQGPGSIRFRLVRLSPASFDWCLRLFPLVFEVAFLEKDVDDLATGQFVVAGDRINGFFDVDEHITHPCSSLSFRVEPTEIATYGKSLHGGFQL